MLISFIIPTKNNLQYLKNAYNSIRKYYTQHEIVILDDASSDGTGEWLKCLNDKNLTIHLNTNAPVGHTILYNIGVKMCRYNVFSIFHADMICGPNYIENLTKHLRDKTVVSATRIEPPLHPTGKEKITKNFGMNHDDINFKEFKDFCLITQKENENVTTKGIFAPWLMYKNDFLIIGGHDEVFAPFPFEDSDIFQRFILNGYNIIQSRDSLVYHLTCRGHRWTEQIQKDDDYYKQCVDRNSKNFLRKWGSWIKNDEYSYPIIKNKYDIGLIIRNCNEQLLAALEPMFSTIYTDCQFNDYIKFNQPNTKFNLTKRIQSINTDKTNDIIIEFDAKQLNQENFSFLTTQLTDVIIESGEVGTLEYDIFKFTINQLNPLQNRLITTTDPHYTSQLL